VVSLLPPYRHPWVPLGPGFLPGTTLSGESPPAGRNQPVEPHRRRRGLNPLLCSRAEIVPGLSEPTGSSRCRCSPFAQCRFIISIRIYSFQIHFRLRPRLASPPLQEGPLESVVRPRQHLRRRQTSVRAEAVVIIPRPPRASHRQPSPTILWPHRPRQQLRPSTALLVDQFPEHLDPATGPAPLFPHRSSTTAMETLLW
jgi:hypothetical protein